MWILDDEWVIKRSLHSNKLRLFHKPCPYIFAGVNKHWHYIGEDLLGICAKCKAQPPEEYITQAKLLEVDLGG